MFKTPVRTLLATTLLLLPWFANAHDLVLVPEPSGDLTVRFGHPSDWQPADRERLLELKTETGPAPRMLAAGLTAKGLKLHARSVKAPGQATLVSARYDNGLWVSVPGPAGKPTYFNTTVAMLPEGRSSMSAIKFAKALYAMPGDPGAYKQRTNQLIELIPQSNPADVRPGGKLKVLVMLDGKALPGVGVEVTDSATKKAEGQPSHQTNALGIAEVPIARAGLNVLSVDHDVPNDGSVAPAMKALPVERIAIIATYAFQVR